ncbi:MAG: KpsF/GutQ family sugar-phosphate isomerase [Campylobacterales bacterium]
MSRLTVDEIVSIAKEVAAIEAAELIAWRDRVGAEMARAVEMIMATRGKLIVTGVGKSGLIGAKIAATLASTGTPSFFLHPTEAMHGDLGMISKGDAVLAISYSGESEELLQILPHLKRFDVPMIVITGHAHSTLGRYADVILDGAVSREACPLNAAPTSSTTLTLAIGDALAVCLMKERGFKEEDFASFHPGGSLGRRLFVKVKDLMRTENLPIVSRETSLRDAIITMSAGRLGALIIADHGVVEGVLSDGDLRRALMSPDFSLDKQAIEYATKNPKICDNEEMLASQAMRIIEEKKIQFLLVADHQMKLKGLLHIHDLIEAGIK